MTLPAAGGCCVTRYLPPTEEMISFSERSAASAACSPGTITTGRLWATGPLRSTAVPSWLDSCGVGRTGRGDAPAGSGAAAAGAGGDSALRPATARPAASSVAFARRRSGKWRVGVTSFYTGNPDICDCSELVSSRGAHFTHIHGRLAAATLNRFCAVEYALLGRLRGSCHAYSPQNLQVAVAGDVVAGERACSSESGQVPHQLRRQAYVVTRAERQQPRFHVLGQAEFGDELPHGRSVHPLAPGELLEPLVRVGHPG